MISRCMCIVFAHILSYDDFNDLGMLGPYFELRCSPVPSIAEILEYPPSCYRALTLHMIGNNYVYPTSIYQIIADLFNHPSSPVTQEFIIYKRRAHLVFIGRLGQTKSLENIQLTSNGMIVYHLIFNKSIQNADAEFVDKLNHILNLIHLNEHRIQYVKMATDMLTSRFPRHIKPAPRVIFN